MAWSQYKDKLASDIHVNICVNIDSNNLDKFFMYPIVFIRNTIRI